MYFIISNIVNSDIGIMKIRKIIYRLCFLCLIGLCGCQEQNRMKELEERVLMLEKNNSEIENEKLALKKEVESLQAEKDKLERLSRNDEVENLFFATGLQGEGRSSREQMSFATQPISRPAPQTQIKKLGRVSLYYYDNERNIVELNWYGENDGLLYLDQSEGYCSYELQCHGSKYHVSVGEFRLSANNGYFEFSAHAGKFYFDI